MIHEKATVLIVDDEPKMVGVVSYAIQVAGFEPIAAYNGSQALTHLEKRHISLIILDVMLPDTNGFELCRQIRHTSATPILLLTAMDNEADVIKGLEVGADDYMVKPFSTRELVLRVEAILRRTRQQPRLIENGRLRIDFLNHAVYIDNVPISLSPLAYRLLTYLVNNAPRVVGGRELLQNVWDVEVWAGDAKMIKVEIYRLRKKIEEDPKNPRYIRTVRGVGYQFIHEEETN